MLHGEYGYFNVKLQPRLLNLQVLSSRNVELVLGYSVANMSLVEGSPVEGSISSRVRLELQQPSQRPSRRAPPGQTMEVDLVLWTAGTQVSIPPSETQSGYQSFPVNGRGQADTDEMLRVKGHPRIFALGDSAGIRDASGKNLPSTAQVFSLSIFFGVHIGCLYFLFLFTLNMLNREPFLY